MSHEELKIKLEVLLAEHKMLIRISAARTIDEVIAAVQLETKRVSEGLKEVKEIYKFNEVKE